jgi:hypothetical protein
MQTPANKIGLSVSSDVAILSEKNHRAAIAAVVDHESRMDYERPTGG